jgi:hypothetical protein
MSKKLVQKTLVIAMMALASSVVYAQQGSSTDVKINSNIKQDQLGVGGHQTMDLGNARTGGSSKVLIEEEITQTARGGAGHHQTMRIGNAANNGTSDVTVKGKITQTSNAVVGSQNMNIGNAE